LEGPIVYTALTVTDERRGDLDFIATAHVGVDGRPLPGAVTNATVAIFDTGAMVHLVGYEDALALGLTGGMLTGNTLTVGGAGDIIEVDVTMPVGFFSHGIQDLTNGSFHPHSAVGQGNTSAAANTLANYGASNRVPTVIGVPWVAYFDVLVSNSRPAEFRSDGSVMVTPSVTFDPGAGVLPTFAHEAYLEWLPPMFSPYVLYLPALGGGDEIVPASPSVTSDGISAGGLLQTGNNMRFTEGSNSVQGKLMLDTAAQATVLSRIAALDLDLPLSDPDFEVEVQGISGILEAPGFFIDRLELPAEGSDLVWDDVPVIVLNIAGPSGATLFGVLGMNLLADRDFLIDVRGSEKRLHVTAPVVRPRVRVADITSADGGAWTVAWQGYPAAPAMILEEATNLHAGLIGWRPVATSELGTISGELTVTSTAERAFFRWVSP
jgi:hypothetical protein